MSEFRQAPVVGSKRVERITSRHGLHQLTAMRRQKMGNPQYELIEVK